MKAAPKPLERQIQRSVLDYLSKRGVTAVHVPNGSVLSGDGRARAIQMASLKKAGLAPGFPDLILFSRTGKVGFFEVKREGEKLGDKQADWSDRFVEWGLPWAIVRSIDDAKESLALWGWA